MVDLFKKTSITDAELLQKKITPLEFIVPDLLPATGLAVLGGAPKMGKSLLMTDLGLAIASGGRFLNALDVRAGNVLYLALEDTERTMQAKIIKMQPDCPGSGGIHFKFDWDDKKQGSLAYLGKWLDSHKDIDIVIIDTIGRFAPSYTEGRYAEQYEKFAALKKFADSRKILLLIVHHLRKTKSADPFEMLYGTNAMAGAADTIWLLQRERGYDYANLLVSGREISDQTLFLKLNKSLLSWFIADPRMEDLLGVELKKVLDILLATGVAMSLHEISIASGFKKPVLSKYLKILIEHGYVEHVGYGKYRSKSGKKEENVDPRSGQRMIS
jgi:hypothetical protein